MMIDERFKVNDTCQTETKARLPLELCHEVSHSIGLPCFQLKKLAEFREDNALNFNFISVRLVVYLISSVPGYFQLVAYRQVVGESVIGVLSSNYSNLT